MKTAQSGGYLYLHMAPLFRFHPSFAAALCVGLSLLTNAAPAVDQSFRPEEGKFPSLGKGEILRGPTRVRRSWEPTWQHPQAMGGYGFPNLAAPVRHAPLLHRALNLAAPADLKDIAEAATPRE